MRIADLRRAGEGVRAIARELAPLLAKEGIDVNNIDVLDMETLQRAMNRAVERHNMARFTPVGDTRELAVAALRLVVEARLRCPRRLSTVSAG